MLCRVGIIRCLSDRIPRALLAAQGSIQRIAGNRPDRPGGERIPGRLFQCPGPPVPRESKVTTELLPPSKQGVENSDTSVVRSVCSMRSSYLTET